MMPLSTWKDNYIGADADCEREDGGESEAR